MDPGTHLVPEPLDVQLQPGRAIAQVGRLERVKASAVAIR
jgi:hypothetical protein